MFIWANLWDTKGGICDSHGKLFIDHNQKSLQLVLDEYIAFNYVNQVRVKKKFSKKKSTM
jgi:hypothetical protein